MEQSFTLVIEGADRIWPKDIATAEEIAGLGAWAIEEGVMALGHDGVERALAPGEIAELARHKSFCRMPFAVTVEGKIKGWHRETITVEEIARLGGWDVSVGVIEVDEESNAERTLRAAEVITLVRRHHHHQPEHEHPHHHHHHHKSYGKKHRWRRG
jgi:hypothetical protein